MLGYTTTGVIGRPSLGNAGKSKLLLKRLVRSFRDHLDILQAA
jgi:hypothetical protein